MDKKVFSVNGVPFVKFENVKYRNLEIDDVSYDYLTKCAIQKNENGNLIIFEANIVKEDIEKIGLLCDIKLEYDYRNSKNIHNDCVKIYKNMTLRMVQDFCECEDYQRRYLVFSDYRIKDSIIKKELNELINKYYKDEKINEIKNISKSINRSVEKVLDTIDKVFGKENNDK